MRSALFRSADLIVQVESPPVSTTTKGGAVHFGADHSCVTSAEVTAIEKAIGDIAPGTSVSFKTDGAWSNWHLLEHILKLTGPAEVCFTTWAISEVAIQKFLAWKERGIITELHAIIDVGLRNRKPAIYHQAVAAFPNLKIGHCHAKATVVTNGSHHITFIGSANYTKNPRKEVGVIIWDRSVAEFHSSWIKEETHGS